MSNPQPHEGVVPSAGSVGGGRRKPTTRRRRWLLACLAGLALVTLVLAIEHYRGAANLRAWREAMRARGEPLTLAELLPPPREGQTPLSLSALVRLLRLDDFQPFAGAFSGVELPYLAPGQARSVWAEPDTEHTLWGTNTWKQLEEVVAQVSEPLGALREQLANRNWTLSVDYSRGPLTETAGNFSFMLAALALRGATHLELHHQRLSAALENLMTLLVLPEDGLPGRLIIGHVGLLAINRIAVPATWQVLQAPGWTDTQLAAVQAAWERKMLLEETALSLAVDRVVMGDRTFSMMRNTLGSAFKSAPALIAIQAAMSPPPGAPPPPGQWLFDWLGSRGVELAAYPVGVVWRLAWLDQDELYYFQNMQEVIDRVRVIAAERSVATAREREDGPAKPVAAASRYTGQHRGKPSAALDRMRYCASLVLLPKLEPLVAMACELETLRSMIVAAVALKRHELRHGGLPADLAALVPEFLTAVPVDYQDGKPMRYRARADGTYLLYSVGDDGQDDGGVAEAAVSSGEPPSLTGGRDWVWPVAAAR